MSTVESAAIKYGRITNSSYVATHQGFVYTAFIIDMFARLIVGWKVAKRMDTNLVMNALGQALYARKKPKHVIHQSDRGSQCLLIRYTERLQASQVTASVGTTGHSYNNALAETVNGLYKTEVIHHQIRGGEWWMLNWQRSTGWIGLTIDVC